MVELILVWYRARILWVLTPKRCFGKLGKELSIYHIFALAGERIRAVGRVSAGVLSHILTPAVDG